MPVLYTDIDGTLVGPAGNLFWASDRSPTLAAAEALVDAARHGLEVVPVTGRSRRRMAEIGRLLGLETWICEFGGVTVYRRDGEIVRDHGAYCGEAVPAAELQPAVAALTARSPGSVEEHTPYNEGREASLVVRGQLDIPAAERFLAGEGFGWAELVDNGVLPRRFESLPGVDPVHAYHLVPRGVSKAAAIAADMRRRGIPRDDTAVVGDAASDIACRTEVGRCFLVANGLVKDPDLAWVREPGSGVRVTKAGHGEGFAEVVRSLLGRAGPWSPS